MAKKRGVLPYECFPVATASTLHPIPSTRYRRLSIDPRHAATWTGFFPPPPLLLSSSPALSTSSAVHPSSASRRAAAAAPCCDPAARFSSASVAFFFFFSFVLGLLEAVASKRLLLLLLLRIPLVVPGIAASIRACLKSPPAEDVWVRDAGARSCRAVVEARARGRLLRRTRN
jgi:hypothetical protein